jgi:hypothetical protein
LSRLRLLAKGIEELTKFITVAPAPDVPELERRAELVVVRDVRARHPLSIVATTSQANLPHLGVGHDGELARLDLSPVPNSAGELEERVKISVPGSWGHLRTSMVCCFQASSVSLLAFMFLATIALRRTPPIASSPPDGVGKVVVVGGGDGGGTKRSGS